MSVLFDLRHRRGRGQVDDGMILRIGRQLAIVTGVTILILLLALGFAVYKTTQSALFDQIKTAAVDRAGTEAQQQELQLSSPPDYLTHPRHHANSQPPPSEGIGRENNENDVYISVMRPDLKCYTSTPNGPDGSDGLRVPDRSAAKAALQTGRSQLASVVYGGTPYLVYTRPVFQSPSQHPAAVIQASISETQYRSSLDTLLKVLLLVGGAGLVASLLITGMVVQRALSPIRGSLIRQRDFVADAAHELRTPISIIRAAGEMLLRDGSTEKREEMAQVTVEEASHLTRLVSELSLLARSDTGTLDFARDPLTLERLVQGVVNDIAVLAEDRSIQLTFESREETTVNGDAMRLRQVFLILLDNALKHTPSGGRIDVVVDATRRRARLKVIDSGPGIPSHDLPRLFDRFYQSNASRTVEGTGLGLAIAESIIRGHGGNISAANRQGGEGSIFTVSLPLAQSRPERLVPPAGGRHDLSGESA